MQYKFKNGAILKVSQKLVIMTTNLLMYYLIMKMSYIGLLLIIKLMFIDIKFRVFKKVNCIFDGLAKPRKKI